MKTRSVNSLILNCLETVISVPRLTSEAVVHLGPASAGSVAEVGVEMEYSQEQVPEGTLELPDAAAFGVVANNKGLISICGFGSLLSGKTLTSA